MPRRKTTVPPISPAEQERLLAETLRCNIRDHLLFALALSCDLSARRLVSPDLGDVLTADGRGARESFRPRARDGRRTSPVEREVILPPSVREAIGRYLAFRKTTCPHWSGRRLGERVDDRGVARCHACGDPLDIRALPLFESRQGCRLSASQARLRFRLWRTRLGLDPALRFESLRQAHLRRLSEVTLEYLRARA